MKRYMIENGTNEGLAAEQLHEMAVEENLIVEEVSGGWIGFESQEEYDTWNNQV